MFGGQHTPLVLALSPLLGSVLDTHLAGAVAAAVDGRRIWQQEI